MEKRKIYVFNKDYYLLGKDKNKKKVWLVAPSWDCGWYWGFGYVQTLTNDNSPEKSRDIESHQHFDCLFLKKDIFDSFVNYFSEMVLTNKEVWILLELMNEFYLLKKYAEIAGRGDAHITESPLKNKLINPQAVEDINKQILPAIFEKIDELLTKKENY